MAVHRPFPQLPAERRCSRTLLRFDAIGGAILKAQATPLIKLFKDSLWLFR
jgi:hypothetical protein